MPVCWEMSTRIHANQQRGNLALLLHQQRLGPATGNSLGLPVHRFGPRDEQPRVIYENFHCVRAEFYSAFEVCLVVLLW